FQFNFCSEYNQAFGLKEMAVAFICTTQKWQQDERQTKKCNIKPETEETYREDSLCDRQLLSFTTVPTGK
ncbi:hypothetical protein DVA81_18345, partial [Acinetobacter baumannii]